MNTTSFFKKIFIATLVLAILTFIICRVSVFTSTQVFIWSSLAFFFILSCGVYFLAARGISTKNNYRFVSLITGSFTGKLLLCVVFILLYALIAKPEGKPFFIIPFFIYYAVFTVIEVLELVKLTRNATPKQ